MPLQISDTTTTVTKLDSLHQKLLDIPQHTLTLLEPNQGRVPVVGRISNSNDYGLTVFILVVFLIFVFTFNRSHNIFVNLFKDLFSDKKSRSFTNEQSFATTRSRLLLIINSLLIEGFIFSKLILSLDIHHLKTSYSWAIGIALSLAYYIFQIITNNVISYIYIHKQRKGNITKSINNIYIIKSLLLFILSVLTIYTDISINFTLYYCIATLFISKVLFIYRSVKLFFSGIYQIIYVVLYLCALEIAPLFILYKLLFPV